MSGLDGDVDEMPVPPLDDRALEALLSGAPSAQSGFDWLVPFVEDLEKASQEPAPVVRPALALLLKEGFSPAIAAPATAPDGAAPTAPSPAPAAMPPAPRAERPVLRPVLRGALGRVAGLGLLAKAGLGFSLVAASTTAAGAAGVLPGPAQHAVAKVVGAATPFTFPDRASDKADHGRNVSTDATGAGDGVAGVDGKAVSDAAKTTPGSSGTGANSAGANGAGVGPSDSGATGLDRANETPAAGHVPTSLPGRGGPPATPGKSADGPDTPKTTPAAGNVPTSLPASKPAGPPATASPGGERAAAPPSTTPPARAVDCGTGAQPRACRRGCAGAAPAGSAHGPPGAGKRAKGPSTARPLQGS